MKFLEKFKVLIGCEESQVICKAFRALGVEAYSCDLEPCSGGHEEWHIQGDVLDQLDKGWDLAIFHPVCQYITNSGVRWLYNSDGTLNKDRWDKLDAACAFFNTLLNAPIPYIAIENPIPHRHALERLQRKYDQIIQPYEFGHLESKATCLWLKNLPLLQPTWNRKEEMKSLPKKETNRIHYMSPGPERAKLRSKTFQGIGEAIANQYMRFIWDQQP